jgi:hypothetical protein
MGGRRFFCWIAIAGAGLVGCEEAEPPPERLEIDAAHRSCQEGEACGVVETSCVSQGCECGVAVNAAHLLHYQQQLAECRGQNALATCDFQCQTPFGKCFEGACRACRRSARAREALTSAARNARPTDVASRACRASVHRATAGPGRAVARSYEPRREKSKSKLVPPCSP